MSIHSVTYNANAFLDFVTYLKIMKKGILKSSYIAWSWKAGWEGSFEHLALLDRRSDIIARRGYPLYDVLLASTSFYNSINHPFRLRSNNMIDTALDFIPCPADTALLTAWSHAFSILPHDIDLSTDLPPILRPYPMPSTEDLPS